MRRGGSILLALLAAVLVNAEGPKRTQLIRFPGPPNIARSPDGRYALENVDSPPHELYLRNAREQTGRLLYRYTRNVSVLWRNDSAAFVLNDFYASNQSNSYVYLLAELDHPIDIYKELRRKLTSDRERKTIFENDHVYMEGVRWLDSGKLKLDICGHGEVDKNGFLLVYEYRLHGSFRLLSRKTGNGC